MLIPKTKRHKKHPRTLGHTQSSRTPPEHCAPHHAPPCLRKPKTQKARKSTAPPRQQETPCTAKSKKVLPCSPLPANTIRPQLILVVTCLPVPIVLIVPKNLQRTEDSSSETADHPLRANIQKPSRRYLPILYCKSTLS